MVIICAQNFKKERGVAVLTCSILLSAAAILFTTHMASLQLFDNQIMANYYRNNEALASAESGINFVLAKLDNSSSAALILTALPIDFSHANPTYFVQIDKLTSNKLNIRSIGKSEGSSAIREINIEISFSVNYPIPIAPLSTNGKLILNKSASINDGCEGLVAEDCLASTNIAENILVTNPSTVMKETVQNHDLCTVETVSKNIIADGTLFGLATQKEINMITDDQGNQSYAWMLPMITEGSEMAGLTADSALQPKSLFEATFAIEKNQENMSTIWDNAVRIDMTDGGDCTDQLQDVSDEDEIIFIKGDCDISQVYSELNASSHNKIFTIGSFEHPKLVFIEGGSFVSEENIQTKIVGLLYFLPGQYALRDTNGNLVDTEGELLASHESPVIKQDNVIDMGLIDVNGALLSEYQCSFNRNVSSKQVTPQNFSIRYDKQVLNKLYEKIGMKAVAGYYQISPGSWRDF